MASVMNRGKGSIASEGNDTKKLVNTNMQDYQVRLFYEIER